MIRRPISSSRQVCDRSDGSAIISVLIVVALLSMVLAGLLQGVRLERKSSSSFSRETEARMAADSAVAAAMARLTLCTSNSPAFVVGLTPRGPTNGEIAPALVLASTNLSHEQQLIPLFSCDLKPLSSYPKIPSDYAAHQISNSLSSNPAVAVDLNGPDLLAPHHVEDTNSNSPERLIAPHGNYPALWQYLRDNTGKTIARYAFVMTDESACLNPALHGSTDRTNPVDWDTGPGDLPLTNSSGTLLTHEEATLLHRDAPGMPTEECFAHAFSDQERFQEKRFLLTRDPCLLPDLIPSGYPESGLPKYNLNDLATNPVWGATPYARATNIAAIIDRNYPKFKMRDPSLPVNQRILYLQRLACSIVDYISAEPGPTGPSPSEPLGRDLNPYVTQIGERCVRKDLTSNSVTIESRFFAEVWNPTTSTIPAGGIASLTVTNRARVLFGTGIAMPFHDYHGSSTTLPAIRPNELLVIAFPPDEQTWTSPTVATSPPSWKQGPVGNDNESQHQAFLFSWNGKIVDRTRPAGISPGDQAGGLMHLEQQLSNSLPFWQCMIAPTGSSRSSGDSEEVDADEAIAPGSYRAVGDPRQNILTTYLWPAVKDYQGKTRWSGVNPAGLSQTGPILDPMNTWTRRDRVLLNPATGVRPSSTDQNPDTIPNPYNPSRDSIQAPSVIRKGAMTSIGELGNIYDPAQVDDTGEAPKAGGKGRESVFCSGGGRTLRFGQPEFHSANPKVDWEIPGKRAVDLYDLFTVKDQGRLPGSTNLGTNAGIPGRINVNTASHEVLTALFSGVAVTSDRRFTNCAISAKSADDLATLIEQKRPFDRLSDMSLLTTNLVNAETYLPALSRNAPGSSPPAADVVDRAREEAFGKIIGHCCVQSRTFRIVAVGQALDSSGKPVSTSVMEGIIHLTPDQHGHLAPSLHDVRWR
jgi:type II secretory pathway pseudopilin PulG